MCFLILVNVTSERTIALVATVSGGGEWLPAPEMERWQECFRVGWNADGRSGAAERIALGNAA